MRTVCLDCSRLQEPTAATIDHIARLKLAARRCGCDLQLSNANADLVELIGFVGLARVLGVELERQTEHGEQPGGVEEEGQLDDPSLL